MSTVPPPTAPIAPPSAAGSAPTVTVTQPPPDLIALPTGASLEATVAALRPGPIIELQTPYGILQAATSTPLKVQQPITLLVQPRPASAPTVVLQLIEIAGRPVPGAPALAAGAQGSTQSQAPAPAPGITPATFNLSVGQSVTAVLLQASAPSGGPGMPNSTVAPATGASATPSAPIPSTPAAPPASAPPAVPQGPATPGVTANKPLAAPTQPTQQPALAAGSRISLTIQSIDPKPIAPVTIGPGLVSTAGQTVPAVITGATPTGQPIAQTPAGPVAIENAPPLPKGAEIVFKLELPPTPPDARPQLPIADGRAALTAIRSWPALDETLAAIADRSPALAHQINSVIMPQADAKLSATLIFLLSALKGGDLKSWLGETAIREAGRANVDVLRRLQSDVRLLAGSTDDGEPAPVRPTGDWRVLPIPFHGDGIEQIRLLVRDDGDQDDAQDDGKETRFVVDLTMTSIGRLQLDGLIDVGARRFDMLVRTESILPERFRRDILGIFAASNETIGLSGGLSFRAAPDALIDAAPVDKPRADGGIMV